MGAGGTIQRQLELGLDSSAKANFLFYANDRAYKKTNLHHHASFLPLNERTEKAIYNISRTPEILEIVLVGSEQTTLGYQKELDGTISVVQPSISYSQEHLNKVTLFNLGVENYILLSQHFNCTEHEGNNREFLALLLNRLINTPTKEEALYLGQLTHEDNFGSNRAYSVIEKNKLKEGSVSQVEKYWRNHCINPMDSLYKTTWPQGELTLADPNVLVDFYQLRSFQGKHNDSINVIMTNLTSINTDGGVIIYGAGEFFLELEPVIASSGIKIASVVDKRASFGNFDIKDYQVISLEQLDSNLSLPIVVASKAFLSEIRDNIKNKLKNEVIIISC